MSDKHAPSGGTAQQQQQPWNKATLKPAHIAQISPNHLYDPSSGLPIYGGVAPGPSSSSNHAPSAHHSDGLRPYAAARFQAPPPILSHSPQPHSSAQHQAAASPSGPAGCRITAAALASPPGCFPHVPVQPSGFVPPTFPPSASAPSSAVPANMAANPSPFPVNQQADVSLPYATTHNPYGVDKIMNSVSSSATALPKSPLSLLPGTSDQTTGSLQSTVIRQLGVAAGEPSPISGAITATITENVLKAIGIAPASGNNPGGRHLNIGAKPPDPEKLRRIHEMVEANVGDHAKQQIMQILERVATLKPIERLLLYLRLPGEAPETDPLRQPQNPLGTRSEINHTINWVRSHLQHDPQVSIPKQDVYDDYTAYCERMRIKPLSTADFGKVMKQVFPGIRPRRLGTRGHSRYCYAAMRKTTALPSPQLPLLQAAGADDAPAMLPEKKTDAKEAANLAASSGGDTSWDVVKEWAEQMLSVKVSNVGELAERIRAMPAGRMCPKKYTPREPKEKRTPTDMGPLKKRRKKKRKGSSSSESSTSQLHLNNVGPSGATATVNNNNNTNSITDQDPSSRTVIEHTDVKIKEEVLDSPNVAAKLLTPQALDPYALPVSQADILPMNLAPEQRTVLAKAPAATSHHFRGPATHEQTHPGVRNLTPHILAMPPSVLIPPEAAAVAGSVSAADALQLASPHGIQIKEEINEDYSTTNILCKKVRKAQQTKGFWQATSSPAAVPPTVAPPARGTLTVPETIVTSATPPPPATIVPPAVPIGSYLMGPPAQLGSVLSTSPSNLSVDSATGNGALASTSGNGSHSLPRVVSRNTLQLMAKRAAAIAAAAASGNSEAIASDGAAETAAELPGDLGLPRERVISICNMDKHELDEYLPESVGDVGENSQDQELLQYFQVGDAEGKLNSLDAAKPNRTATEGACPAPSSSATEEAVDDTGPVNEHDRRGAAGALLQAAPSASKSGPSSVGGQGTAASPMASLSSPMTATTATATRTSAVSSAPPVSVAAYPAGRQVAVMAASPSLPPLGSASASLALMSQKHQEQEKQQQRTQQLPTAAAAATPSPQGNKRKINQLPGRTVGASGSDIAAVRKNSTFLPISPNINSTAHQRSEPWGGGVPGQRATSSGYFASPDLARLRSKPSFGKQQSLDCDPMIGAGNHHPLRFIGGGGGGNTTSASAPPSPSVMNQQQGKYPAGFFRNPSHWQRPLTPGGAGASPPLNDHNSIELDIFGAESGADGQHYAFAGFDGDGGDGNLLMPETQRSRSVPLSQLQRRHSPDFNRTFPAFAAAAANESALGGTYSSACTSVAPTPVPGDYGDTTFYSESSNSQHSLANLAAAQPSLPEMGIIEADSNVMLNDMDMHEILGSTDFDTKFSNLSHGNHTATTTCSSSSVGSSSGYSSVTRSVPSTPLPHHRQNLFGRGNPGGSGVRRLLQDDDDLPQKFAAGGAFKYGGGGGGGAGFGGQSAGGISLDYGLRYGSRSMYDNSKSMPATPIATPSFRYSPTNLLLNNGSGRDSFTASISALSGDSSCDPSTIGIINCIGDGLGGSVADGNRSASPSCFNVASELLENF